MVIMAKNVNKHVSWGLLQQSSYIASRVPQRYFGGPVMSCGNIPGLVAQNRQVMSGFSEHLGGQPSESYGLSSFYTPLWDTPINPG